MASANAIIFDLDGLLFDTDWLWAESERRVFSSLGATVTPDHQQQTAHLGTTLATRYWYDTFSLDQQKTPIEKAEAMVVKQVKEEIWRVATLLGGRELIQQALTLRTPIGLASNAPLSICHQALDLHNWTEHFSTITSAEEVLNPKPSPDVYRLAAERLGVSPSRCMAVEDSLSGAEAASLAGMSVTLVSTDLRMEEGSPGIRSARSLKDIDLQRWLNELPN
tara:strand:+ start:428 stop:1093 length:666 start_codon:yes stop_codon:yes gene_type:complete